MTLLHQIATEPVSKVAHGFRPMLSAHITDFPKCDGSTEDALEQMFKNGYFPLLASPKIDGIRVLNHPDLGAVTRTMSKLNNAYIYSQLASFPELAYLDGEIVVGAATAPNVFNVTQSEVMTHHGKDRITRFTFLVFDCFRQPTQPYNLRMAEAFDRVRSVQQTFGLSPELNNNWSVEFVKQELLSTPKMVLGYEEHMLTQGYEGIMLRAFSDRMEYKFGRATAKQGGLYKVKRMADDEAIVMGFEELLSNQNAATADAFGLTERSSHKANLVPKDTLGVLVVKALSGKFSGVEFGIGTGFDAATRKEIWDNRGKYIGRRLTFKYMPYGSLNAPRIPVFKGFRND